MATTDDSIKKNISQNIIKYREKAGLSQKELAARLNTSPSRVSNWEQAANCPTIDILFEVCKVLNVSINDIYGVYPESNMILSFAEREHIEKYRLLDSYGKETVDIVLSRESNRSKQITDLKSRHASVIDFKDHKNSTSRIYAYLRKIASAGVGFYFDDIPTDTLEAPYCEKADFVIGVNGDSMEPTYSDGDLVYVQKTQLVDSGDIGIFIVNGECFIKEVGKEGLISHNPKYAVIPGTEHINCIGKVLGKVKID